MITMRNETSGILLVNKFVKSSPIINAAAYYALITETNEPQQTHNYNVIQNRWVSAKYVSNGVTPPLHQTIEMMLTNSSKLK